MTWDDADDLALMWHIVDERSADLPHADRSAVHSVIATSVLQGKFPTVDEIGHLIAFAAGVNGHLEVPVFGQVKSPLRCG